MKVKLHELGKAFAARELGQVMDRAEKGDSAALVQVLRLGLDAIPAQKRQQFGESFYRLAKETLGRGNFGDSLPLLAAAHKLEPKNDLWAQRVRLLEAALRHRTAVEWRLSLNNMQTTFGESCSRSRCDCDSHFKIAMCLGWLDRNFVQADVIEGIAIYTVGPYHSRSYRGKWTRLLKTVKHSPFNSEPLKPMADVMADFIVEKTPLLQHVDVLVPIPPSASNYSARGFAPNDVVAKYIGARLALPVRHALVRKDGVPTKEASDAELAEQFEVIGKPLSGLSVLLVEDIWTAGRTIPFCAAKLKTLSPRGVSAVALARTRG